MNSAHQRLILGFITHIARHLRLAALLERALVAMTVFLAVLLLGTGLVPLARTIPWLVASLVLLSWAAVGVTMIWLGWGCLRRRSLEAAALYVEARHPELHNSLISALQLPEALQKHPETGISRALVERLLEVTHRHVDALLRQPLVGWDGVWRQARVASPLVVATLGVAWFTPQLLSLASAQLLHPFSLFGSQPTLLTLGDYPRRILTG